MRKIISMLLIVFMVASLMPVGMIGNAQETTDTTAPLLSVEQQNTLGQAVFLNYENVSSALGGNAWIALRKHGDPVRNYVAYIYLTDASGNLKPGISESGSLEILGDGWVGSYVNSYDTLPAGGYDVSIYLNGGYDIEASNVATFYVGNKISTNKSNYYLGEDILVSSSEIGSSVSGGWVTLLEGSADATNVSLQGMAYKYIDSFTEGVPVKLTDFTRQRWTAEQLPAGDYQLILFTSAKKIVGVIQHFTVYAMDIVADDTTYSEGDNVTISFTGLDQSIGTCWLSLYQKDATPEDRNPSVWWTWLVNNGATQLPNESGVGVVTLPADYAPGEYYFVVVSSSYKRLSPEYAITITEKPDPVTMIQPELTNSISLHYTAELDVSIPEDVFMKFTMNGVHVCVPGTQNAGTWTFTFADILPQDMGATILSELYVGEQVVSTREYSVRTYCLNMLEKTTGDTAQDRALRGLLVAMLNYGTEAQKYFDPSVALEDYVNAGVDQSHLSSYEYKVDDAQDALLLDPVANQGDYVWKAATLGLYDELKVRIKFYAADLNGLSIVANDETYTDFVPVNGANMYYVYVPVVATDFDAAFEFTFYKNGTVGTKLTYSVNTFVNYIVTENVSRTMGIVSAIYQYGCAADRYLQEMAII